MDEKETLNNVRYNVIINNYTNTDTTSKWLQKRRLLKFCLNISNIDVTNSRTFDYFNLPEKKSFEYDTNEILKSNTSSFSITGLIKNYEYEFF